MATRRSARHTPKSTAPPPPAPRAAKRPPTVAAARKPTGRSSRVTPTPPRRPSTSPDTTAMETAEGAGSEGREEGETAEKGGERGHEVEGEGRDDIHCHLHEELSDEDEEEEADIGEVLANVPRFDFYFDEDGTDQEQRTLAYRAALHFSTALPPGQPIGDDEAEHYIDTCPVRVEGCGGSGERDEDEDEDDEEEEAQREGEGKEGEGEKGEGAAPARPFRLLFPAAHRVSELLAYLVHSGPFTVWAKHDPAVVLAGRYSPQVRLYWRMDLSDFIPLYC